MEFVPQTSTSTDPILIDSDRESTKSDSESEPVTLPAKAQDMFIWNAKYEVKKIFTTIANVIIAVWKIIHALQDLELLRSFKSQLIFFF